MPRSFSQRVHPALPSSSLAAVGLLVLTACSSAPPPTSPAGPSIVAGVPSASWAAGRPSFSVAPRDPVESGEARAVSEAGLPLFEYDASEPLDVRIPDEPIRETDAAVIHDITYASPMGGRVSALLILPKGVTAGPAVIIQHGMPGSRWDLQPRGVLLSELGVTSILIDAPHGRPPSERLGPGTAPTNFTEQDWAEQIQVIIDLRRAVDLLASRPEVDPDRIGYLGVSFGGAMGGLLAGVEDRIAAYVLAVGDGGLVTNSTGPEDAAGPFAEIPADQQRAWLDLMEPIEPIHYVGRSVAPILFQSGSRDEIVPPHDAAAYHAAGNERSEVRWYDANHGLDQEARCDAAIWLGEHLGFDGRAMAGCRG